MKKLAALALTAALGLSAVLSGCTIDGEGESTQAVSEG